MTKKKEAFKRIIDIIETQDIITEAIELAYQYNISLEEIWDDNDEIVGMMVDDVTIYFN